MGEERKDALRLEFNRRLKLEFHGTNVTSDGGLLAYRELDGALGLTSTVDSEFRDIRTGKNTQHSITALLRQSTPPKASNEAGHSRYGYLGEPDRWPLGRLCLLRRWGKNISLFSTNTLQFACT